MTEKKVKDDQDESPKQKKEYVKPEILSEDLISFGAVCNGGTVGGRKATTVACNKRKLNS